MKFSHEPVLFEETVSLLSVKPDGVYMDGTAGGGGHSAAILKKLTTGKLISIDQDPDAISVLKERFKCEKSSIVVKSNFSEIANIVKDLGISSVDGVLLDLGVSSYQLDEKERGFSYRYDAPLDMRMSKSGLSAFDVVNGYSYDELVKIIAGYGEEKFAGRIARAIEKRRKVRTIKTTLELAEIIRDSIPMSARRSGGHPAKKTFQAIRIAVNDELNVLQKGLDSAFSVLNSCGRLAVITFHSLEDRIVKTKMNSWEKTCTCPPDFPVCVCGERPLVEVLTKKPIRPSENEVLSNPRSRSAKLRVCMKI